MEKYLGDSTFLVKRRNRALILEIILKRGPISRVQISDITHLSRAAVSTLTAELIECGLIHEVPQVTSEERRGAGRIPTMLDIRQGLGGVIAIDIARDRVAGAFINLKGGIDEEIVHEVQDPRALPQVADLVRQLIATLRTKASERGKFPLGIGISLPGIIHRETGILEYSSTLGWENVDLMNIFAKDSDIPVMIDRNARAMVLAEHTFGAGQGFSNLALIYVGTGIGCGLMLNGEIFAGSTSRAGELGHTHVVDGGRRCFCGGSGCLETVASGRAIAELAIEEIEKGNKSLIDDLAGGDLSNITAETVAKAANEGDRLALEIFENAGTHLGNAIANLMGIIDTRLIILAGGVMNAGDLLLKPIRNIITARTLRGGEPPEIRVSAFGDKIGVIGAGALALKELVYSPKLILPGDIDLEAAQIKSAFISYNRNF